MGTVTIKALKYIYSFHVENASLKYTYFKSQPQCQINSELHEKQSLQFFNCYVKKARAMFKFVLAFV